MHVTGQLDTQLALRHFVSDVVFKHVDLDLHFFKGNDVDVKLCLSLSHIKIILSRLHDIR